MSRPLDFRLLGPLEVRGGERTLPLGGRKQRTLLAILLLHANEVVSSDTLIDGLWGERAPKTAGTALQVYVSNLRKLLSPERLETRTPGYLLRVEPEELDLARFERLCAEARPREPGAAAAALAEALALWRGRPLADFAYEAFAQGEIARLEELRLAVIEQRIDADLELGRHAELVGELEALVAQHPSRERLISQLMLALYRSGRQTEALEAYRHARQVLVEELGIEPSPALRELEKAILAQDSGLAVPARPERVPTNLPTPAPPLIGRERELEEAGALLGSHRLLTLTGPGGSGKTRLALELAAEAAEQFPDGVYWVPLQAVRDPDLVLPTMAQTLGARAEVAEQIGGRSMLLLLDNLEQLLDVAPALSELLERAPELKLLVTSREPLHLAAEREYPVAPLSERDAVVLFGERARAVKPDFEADEAVPEICRRLDCLPLAIELAAARTKALAPTTLLQRLEPRLALLTGGARDVPERQRTLSATIAWSYDLLSEQEQTLFRRLADFTGGWMLDAAEEVCDAELDTLASLVDKSLVRSEGERYSMLDTIREFALERLEESGGSGVTMERLAEYLLSLGENQEGTFRSAVDRGLSFVRLEPELANFRAAIDWALRAPAPMLAMRLAILPTEGRIRSWGNPAEERRWAKQALAHIEDAPLRLRADVLRAAGVTSAGETSNVSPSDVEQAIGLLEESLSLYRQLGDHVRVANVLRWLASSHMRVGLDERARLLLEEGLDVAATADDAFGTYAALRFLGDLERHVGNLDEAVNLYEQSVTQASRAGDDRSVAMALHSWADLALRRNELDRAVGLYNQSLKLAHEIGLPHLTIYCFAGLASAVAASGACEQAGRLWGAVETAQRETGWSLVGSDHGFYEERVRACADDEAATFEAALELGRKMSLDDAVAYAFSAQAGLATSSVGRLGTVPGTTWSTTD